MIGSFLRFVSDWARGESRQPPPFRPQRDLENPPTGDDDVNIEMRHLLPGPRTSLQDKDPDVERAIREWKSIDSVDLFLEQVDLLTQLLGSHTRLFSRFMHTIRVEDFMGSSSEGYAIC